MGHERDEWPFLSIVSWPNGWDRQQTADCLAQAGGLEAATVRLRLGQPPPMVLMQVEPASARRMAAALAGAGGDAFTFTLADLAAVGPTLKIREMRIEEGALNLDLWSGLSTMLPIPAVQVLVRAQLSRTVVERREPPRLSWNRLIRTPDSIRAEIESSVTKTLKTSDRIDIHTDRAGIYQVDADRFGFGILGDLRGYGDKTNADSLCELLSHLAPHAVVDMYYPLWRPPPRHHRLRIKGIDSARDDLSFEFYSRWAGMMYRHVMSE